MIILINIFVIGYLVYYKPYEKHFYSHKQIAVEVLFTFSLILLMPIVDNESFEEHERSLIGWVIISLCVLIFLIELSVFLYEVIGEVYTKVKAYLKNRKCKV